MMGPRQSPLQRLHQGSEEPLSPESLWESSPSFPASAHGFTIRRGPITKEHPGAERRDLEFCWQVINDLALVLTGFPGARDLNGL